MEPMALSCHGCDTRMKLPRRPKSEETKVLEKSTDDKPHPQCFPSFHTVWMTDTGMNWTTKGSCRYHVVKQYLGRAVIGGEQSHAQSASPACRLREEVVRGTQKICSRGKLIGKTHLNWIWLFKVKEEIILEKEKNLNWSRSSIFSP